jgi:hypothetical protein
LTPTPFGASWSAEKGVRASDLVDGLGGRCSHQCRLSRRIAAVERAARHPFAAQVGGMMGCAGACWPVGSIRGIDHATSGGHDLHDPHRPAVRVTAPHAATGLLPCSARTRWSRRA